MYESGYSSGNAKRHSMVFQTQPPNGNYLLSDMASKEDRHRSRSNTGHLQTHPPVTIHKQVHLNPSHGFAPPPQVMRGDGWNGGEPVYHQIVRQHRGPMIINSNPAQKIYQQKGMKPPPNCLNGGFACLGCPSKCSDAKVQAGSKGGYAMKTAPVQGPTTRFYENPRRPFIRRSHEQIYPMEPAGAAQFHQMGKVGSYEMQPKSCEQVITVQEGGVPYVFRPDPAPAEVGNALGEMIRMKDQQIKELEKNVVHEGALNSLDSNYENHQLKEKLLDQKIKYEETLKHIKKLENEKRNLKKNLTVRDKVLTKLEDDIGHVDYENEFLSKARENTDLKEIHNVFKYLHGDANQIMKKSLKSRIRESSETDSERHSNLHRYPGKGREGDSDDSNGEEGGEQRHRYSYRRRSRHRGPKKNALDNNDVYALKSTVVALEKEVRDLKEENKNVSFKYENTFKTLSELRKDTLEYMESIVSRDMRIAYMETALQKCEKDLVKLKEHFKKAKMGYEEKIDELNSEIRVLEKQASHLQEMIQEKDAQIVLLKNEIVRNETLIRQFEERNKELQGELKLMCGNLENVIEASNNKDLYMNELERQLRENEVNRQHAYLKEVAKNRKVHTEMKFKEILYDRSAKDKMNQVHDLKQELFINNIHVQKAKEAYDVLKRVPKKECLINCSSDNQPSYYPTHLDLDADTKFESDGNDIIHRRSDKSSSTKEIEIRIPLSGSITKTKTITATDKGNQGSYQKE